MKRIQQATLLISLLLAGSAIRAQQEPTEADAKKIRTDNINRAAKTSFQYFITRAGSGQYGYSIYADGNLFIQQTTIPSLPGNKAFTDTTSAGKVARLVIRKIKEGEMPPTITPADLQRTGIKFK